MHEVVRSIYCSTILLNKYVMMMMTTTTVITVCVCLFGRTAAENAEEHLRRLLGQCVICVITFTKIHMSRLLRLVCSYICKSREFCHKGVCSDVVYLPARVKRTGVRRTLEEEEDEQREKGVLTHSHIHMKSHICEKRITRCPIWTVCRIWGGAREFAIP